MKCRSNVNQRPYTETENETNVSNTFLLFFLSFSIDIYRFWFRFFFFFFTILKCEELSEHWGLKLEHNLMKNERADEKEEAIALHCVVSGTSIEIRNSLAQWRIGFYRWMGTVIFHKNSIQWYLSMMRHIIITDKREMDFFFFSLSLDFQCIFNRFVYPEKSGRKIEKKKKWNKEKNFRHCTIDSKELKVISRSSKPIHLFFPDSHACISSK